MVPSGNDLEDFQVLKWKLKEDSPNIRHLFVKEHRSKGEPNLKKPNGRTLFIINVPPYIANDALKDLFSPFGKIESIFIHQEPSSKVPEETDRFFPSFKSIIRGYHVAYIVYSNFSSVKSVLSSKKPLILGPTLHGLSKYVSEYNKNIVNKEELEENVKKFMAKYEEEEVRRKAEAKSNDGVVDEDGWTVISRSGKKPGTVLTEKIDEKLRAKKRRQERELLNYTPLQIKESRLKELTDLKKRFEEDKQRIALMRQQRKFKPF